jgi:hypothetical protein
VKFNKFKSKVAAAEFFSKRVAFKETSEAFFASEATKFSSREKIKYDKEENLWVFICPNGQEIKKEAFPRESLKDFAQGIVYFY